MITVYFIFIVIMVMAVLLTSSKLGIQRKQTQIKQTHIQFKVKTEKMAILTYHFKCKTVADGFIPLTIMAA